MAVPLKPSLSNRMTCLGFDVNLSSNSAQLAKAEREIKQLQQENAILKKNFKEISSLYTQLIGESNHENYGEWRVMLLKSQVIQLERQVLLLTDALSRRSAVILDVENSLAAVVDLCRSTLMQTERMPSVKLARADFERLADTVESSRMKLFKDTELMSADNVKQPLQTMNPFIRNQHLNEAVSLLDLCTGQTDHINIKHVSQLETNLMALYKQLKLVASSLDIFTSASDVPKAVHVRLAGQVAKACDMLHKTNQKLLYLSVLVPAAPLPALYDSAIQQLNTENVLKALQKNGRRPTNQKDLRCLVDALLKAVNYSVYMANAEKDLLLDELKFHQGIYDHLSDYVTSLLASIKEEYFRFESDLQAMICKPLKEILASFESLKDSTNDKSIEVFFRVFKSHAHELSATLNTLSAVDNKCLQEKEEFLSQYGKTFSENLFLAHMRCEQERDKRVSKLDSVRTEQADHLLELSKLFPATGKDFTTNSTCHGDSCQKDADKFGANDIELPSSIASGQTDGCIPKQNELDTKLVKTKQNSFFNLTDVRKDGHCTCSSDLALQQTTDQQPKAASKPVLFRKDCTPDALVTGKVDKKNRGTFKQKEPLTALLKLRLKQPVACNLSSEQPSPTDTAAHSHSRVLPSSCQVMENSHR